MCYLCNSVFEFFNFSFTNSGMGVSLDYDEIVISREVFPDGSNRYGINGTEVRLKDIVDFFCCVFFKLFLS